MCVFEKANLGFEKKKKFLIMLIRQSDPWKRPPDGHDWTTYSTDTPGVGWIASY